MAESTAPRRGHELVLRLECLSINGNNNNDNNAAADDNGIAVDVDAVISNISDPPTVQIVGDVDEERGARRMAAMRRRRVKGGGGGSSKPELAGEETMMTMMTMTNEISTAIMVEESALVVEAEESSPTVVAKTNSGLESVTLETTATTGFAFGAGSTPAAFGSTPGGFVISIQPAAATPAPTTMATHFAFGVGVIPPADPSTGGFGGAATSFGYNSTPAPTNTPGIGFGGNPMATPNSVQGFAVGVPSFNSTPSFTGSATATPSTNGGGAGAFSIGTGGTKKTPGKGPTSFSPRMTSGDNGEAVCYLCLDGGLDDAGQSLRRDCACRGTDAGFVHLACLTDYAETKSKQSRDMKEFVNPWETCPGCHQEYQNELAVDIATKFVSFVRRQYPDDTKRLVESLYLKLYALNNMLNMLQPRQKIEAGVTANVLLSLIDRMKADAPPFYRRYSQFEANTLGFHGRIALNEGTEEGARQAVVHFENQLRVNKAIGDDDGIATAKSNIAFVKSKYEGGNNEEVLKATHDVYKLRAAEHGEGSEVAIDAGKVYAMKLQDAHRGGEAAELLTKLLATSKRVLGPNHSTTKQVESVFKRTNNNSIHNDAYHE
jgi:hypothetical protein